MSEMTKEEAKRVAEMLLAYVDGATIQVKSPSGQWITPDQEPKFDLGWGNYRIKPATRFCRVWLHRSTSGVCPWLIKDTNAEFNWDSFAKLTQGFEGWLTEPMEYEP